MGPLILLAIYISFFGAVHSFMAARWFKSRVYRFVDPQRYRLIYSVVSVLLFIPILVVWGSGRDSSPLIFVVSYPYRLISYLVMLSAVALFFMTALQIDVLEFLGLNGFFGEKEEDSKLITDGFYRFCRHPMYFFAIIALWAFPMLKQIDMVGNGFITLYFLLGAWLEEQRMMEDFGSEYQEYRQNVSMFIPFKWFKRKLKR